MLLLTEMVKEKLKRKFQIFKLGVYLLRFCYFREKKVHHPNFPPKRQAMAKLCV